MAHFLSSMVLIADAVVLHVRASRPEGTPRPVVEQRVRTAAWIVVALTAVVLVTGTIVTGTGPHGGDENVQRLGFSVTTVARVHGVTENILLVAVLVTLWLIVRTQAPASVRRDANILLVVLIAQAGVGYAQYFTGVPVVLVGIHILGAVCVWIAALRLPLRMQRVDLGVVAPPLVEPEPVLSRA
jgi:cytochrome c oxidase assembly protein subunit 15